MRIVNFLFKLYLFFYFIEVLVFAQSEDNTLNGTLNLNHVVIRPPTNLAILFTSQTNFLIKWDAPAVYLIHGIQGEKAAVSRHEADHVAVKVVNETNPVDVNATQVNETNTSDDSIPVDETPHVWSDDVEEACGSHFFDQMKCKELNEFSNYIVGDPNTNDSSTVLFKDMKPPKKHQITLTQDKSKEKIVKFNEGCLLSYRVSWKEKNGRDHGHVSLCGSGTQANITGLGMTGTGQITGLKPGVEYSVSVEAYFMSGDALESTKLYVTTIAAGKNDTCTCDYHGSSTIKCNANEKSPCTCFPGYGGDYCTSCSPGHYRSASFMACTDCPCNKHGSRKAMCNSEEGFVKCECETGYHGNICHLCDKGYYKYEGRCVPCFCSGHAPPDTDEMCRQETGECLDCQHNTTGFTCERCLPGYKQDNNGCVLDDSVETGRSISSISPGVVAAVIVAGLLVICVVVGALWLRRNRNKRGSWKFWTVEMRRDRDGDEFTSVHNDDAHMDEVDDVNFFEGGTQSSKYARLHEDA